MTFAQHTQVNKYFQGKTMNFKQHAAAGAATGFIVAGGSYYFLPDPRLGPVLGLIALAGALCPDIDTGSIPSRIFAWVGIAISLLLIYKGSPEPAAYIGIVYMAFSSDRHRGFTHKWILPIGCFVIGGISIYYPETFPILMNLFWLIPFGLGLVTHYIIDKIPPTKII